ncbi:MAG TPA: hypothetical protein VEG32_09030 [Clostridia bacterium]|nr:hypothetical protein [Clostridia bacterium]
MLSKCANPDCSAEFHYLGDGKLFAVHFEDEALRRGAGRSAAPASKRHPRSVEHFWLCSECSEKMTVGLDRSHNVRILPRHAKGKAQSAVAS